MTDERFIPWQDEALCAQTDPNLFFPEKGEPATEAKKICVNCPVQMECLEYAQDRGMLSGVWGNKTAYERRMLRVAS